MKYKGIFIIFKELSLKERLGIKGYEMLVFRKILLMY